MRWGSNGGGGTGGPEYFEWGPWPPCPSPLEPPLKLWTFYENVVHS